MFIIFICFFGLFSICNFNIYILINFGLSANRYIISFFSANNSVFFYNMIIKAIIDIINVLLLDQFADLCARIK